MIQGKKGLLRTALTVNPIITVKPKLDPKWELPKAVIQSKTKVCYPPNRASHNKPHYTTRKHHINQPKSRGSRK